MLIDTPFAGGQIAENKGKRRDICLVLPTKTVDYEILVYYLVTTVLNSHDGVFCRNDDETVAGNRIPGQEQIEQMRGSSRCH